VRLDVDGASRADTVLELRALAAQDKGAKDLPRPMFEIAISHNYL
jgi:hypothetical protein